MSTKTTVSVETLLQKLITNHELPTLVEMMVLSDLSLPNWQRVRGLWSAIPEDRRHAVVSTLVQASQEDIQIQIGRLLRVALDDDSERIRVLAVQGLWEDTAEDLVGPFVHLLQNDPYQEVRAAAAAALGAFVLAGELEELEASYALTVEEALLAVLHSETEPLVVQCRALESVAFSSEVGIRQLIEDAYYSPYEEMQISALVAMGRSADTRWRTAARTELENSAPAVRAEAARACGELEDRAALPHLINLLSDEELSVRLAAIFALGLLGGQEAEEALQFIAESEDPTEAEAALHAIEDASFYSETDIALFEEIGDDWDDDSEDW